MDLNGKHALVTGGGTGIGLAIAQAYAAAGPELSEPSRLAAQQFFAELEVWVQQQLPEPQHALAPVIVSALEGALLLDRDQPQAQRLNALEPWLTSLFGATA